MAPARVMEAVLLSSAVDMGQPGKDNLYGAGRLDLGVFNAPPELTYVGDRMVSEGQLLAFTLSALDNDNDSLFYAAQNLPAGASLHPTTGELTWRPAYTQAGVFSGIRLQVTDGYDVDYEEISITVDNVIHDINDSGVIDLADCILALRVATGVMPATELFVDAEINGDGRIGLSEAVHAIQAVAGMRDQ